MIFLGSKAALTMRDFYINPLSANEQCHTEDDVLLVVKNVVDCIKDLWPAIQKKRINLIYDPSIESRSLIRNQILLASICNLPKADEVGKRWFLYTRNQPCGVEEEREVTVRSSQDRTQVITGNVFAGLIQSNAHWLSFGKRPVNESAKLEVERIGQAALIVQNAHDLDSLRILIPCYEPSDKHGCVPYIDAKGRHVSPMTLSPDSARRLLLVSLRSNGGTRWAYLDAQDKWYCFKPTHNDLSVYHGFQVERHEVPENILKELNPRIT